MGTDIGTFELIKAVALGLALAAAVGLRIFVPLLALSAASLAGVVHLGPGMEWLGSVPALVIFLVATLVELAAYKVPWLDNTLDAAGAPIAVLAGGVLAASVLPTDDPLLRWVLAAVAGGAAAGTVHLSMAMVRKLSSLTTGGLANIVIALAEAVGSFLLSVAAILLPLLAAVAAALLLLGLAAAARRLLARRRVV